MDTMIPLHRGLYRGLDRMALEREYDARGSVPCFDTEYARYVEESVRVKREHSHLAGLCYDPASGETLDFYPAEPGAPLFLWVHGGYWRSSSKDDNAFVVPGLKAHGFAVAVMDYTLAPAASLDEIVRQTRAAVAFLHHNRAKFGIGAGPLAVGGSSAGGHLVGMLLAGGWHGDFGVPEDVIGTALALSGLHDLEPLAYCRPNEWLNLDPAAVERNSPIGHIPRGSSANLIAAAGGRETAEFRRQTVDYAVAWAQAGNTVTGVAMPDHNHFDIALSLREPDGALARAVAKAVAAAVGSA